jgi:cytochrome b
MPAMIDKPTPIEMVKVWDPLVRLLHWSLAAAVLMAMVTEERGPHEAAGYVALALLAVRIVWGFIGPRHARFASFVQAPPVVAQYLRDVMQLRARRYLGHNPAGGAMILTLMLTAATAGVTGWLSETNRFFGVGWIEDLHAAAANLLIVLILLHVIGVILSSLLHRENLMRAMVTGRKPRQITQT